MMRTGLALFFGFGAVVAIAACGETSGAVLERIPEHTQVDAGGSVLPGTNLRVDAFVVRSIATCVIGERCDRNNEPDMRENDCFELELDDGTRDSFRGDTLTFVSMDDPRYAEAMHKACFDLRIDDRTMSEVRENFEAFATRVYQLSRQEIVLDVHIHEIGAMSSGFARFENEWGIFIAPNALEGVTSALSRETDFTFVVTGAHDEQRGITPRTERCAVTVRDLEDGLAGAGYTFFTTECNGVNTLLRNWMVQVSVALRDANGFNDAYDHYYPACDEAEEDPTRWWPNPEECSVDPDAPTCGEERCEGTDEDFVRHVLTEHWPRRRSFVGNHCNNDEIDFDETTADVGGACAVLDR